MRAYAVALTVHMLGLIAIFAGFAMQHRAAQRLRQAAGSDAARPWAELLFVTRAMLPSGAVLLLASGAYMGSVRFPTTPAPWMLVAVAVVLYLAIIGVLLARRFGAIYRGVIADTGTLSAADRARIVSP